MWFHYITFWQLFVFLEILNTLNFPNFSIENCNEDTSIEIIKEDPTKPNTYKIICADTDDQHMESNYEIQSAGETLLEIYEFQGDGCIEKVSTNSTVVRLTDDQLTENIARLLKTVVDEDVLTKFGYPKTPIERVLSSVIKQCGQSPVDASTCRDTGTKLRENVKLLFTSVIDDESIKEMLNNHTIDEVVCHVIKLSEKNWSQLSQLLLPSNHNKIKTI